MRPDALLLSASLVFQGARRLLALSWRRATGSGSPGGRQTAPLSFLLVGLLALSVGLAFFAFVITNLIEAFVPAHDAVLAWCFLTLLASVLGAAAGACWRALLWRQPPRLPPNALVLCVPVCCALSGLALAAFGARPTMDALFLACIALGAIFLLAVLLLIARGAPGTVRRMHRAGLDGLSAHARLRVLAVLGKHTT